MSDPNFIILYVDHPENSARFYADLLGKAPVEVSPTFAMFALESGFMLGLWSKHTVEPSATPVGGSEVAFSLADNAAVDALYRDWSARGIPIAQTLTVMDFGYTFVALDPDHHRLRVFAPAVE
ncbi:drug:proton antiporter [Betaproteobacteria bacterium]|nr:drug:proton antiporter [Betaproteobacteria bacterium]GHT99177.1 drug:proton antiporter [Betaproteobacteria bacterium]GHU24882.1 drug:proton antiporter [Betaproteobacteria bacterium]GHU25317.1 drug:proton antiporter [Betaproteobacteria bacterium]